MNVRSTLNVYLYELAENLEAGDRKKNLGHMLPPGSWELYLKWPFREFTHHPGTPLLGY